ncbi:MAG TPA: biotin/lipoyl-containing protein [Bryobacteraceae bacterium]|nr:biotin/lipoyl-containing protein [Bryobacteraceae bacterium]
MKEAGGAQIVAVEPGVYSVLLDGRSYEARVEQSADCVIVFIDGHRFEVKINDPRRWSRSAGKPGIEGRSNVVANMPGKIVRLLVAEGDTVEAAQGLLVVEAMKMQNEMKAPKAGRIVALPAREGETVAAGEVLAVIE